MLWKKWAVRNGFNNLDIFPATPFHVAIYLSSLVQTSLTVSPVTTAYNGCILSYSYKIGIHSFSAKHSTQGYLRECLTCVV